MNKPSTTSKLPGLQVAPAGSALSVVPDTTKWKRQPGESVPAFAAFEVYLQVKEEQAGGIREVARRVGKAGALLGRWSRRWDWVERQRLYENHCLLVAEGEMRSAARQKAREWASRRIDIRDQGFDVGKQMIDRAKKLLGLPVEVKEIREVVKITKEMVGDIIPTLTILNFQQHPRDARLFADTGVKLMRLSADMSTENLGLLESDSVDFDAMTDEELDAYAGKLEDMRKVAIANGDIGKAAPA